MSPFIRSTVLSARCSSAGRLRALYSSRICPRFMSTLPAKPEWVATKKFSPENHQNGWYDYWESRSLFEPRPNLEKSPVRMLLPPPNVTGELHVGHALTIAVQDSLARYYRMAGHPVEWIPGTDHAGIATQNMVEKTLQRDKGAKKEDLGREAFVKEVEKWREQYGGRILEQMKALGASTTNSKEYYTLDEPRSKAVTSAFVRLWEEGLIYRDSRIVNWSVGLQTAVSDIEVTTREVEGRTNIKKMYFGTLYKFAYPLAEGEGEIVVSTTRPETIPGDRAIAVHPDDERYKHLHYKYVRHPLLPDVTLPIIPDAELVDPEFGTGAVKITPAHDANDYAFWLRHSTASPVPQPSTVSHRVDIPLIQVIARSGGMTSECGIESLTGLGRPKARHEIIKLLKEAEAYRGDEDHKMTVRICERSGEVIEPLLQPQWYLKTKPLAEKVLKVANQDGLTFIPKNPPYHQMWEQWLENIEDWCLSRQIWWGHQIPAYKVVQKEDDSIVRWIAAESLSDAEGKLTEEERSLGYVLEQDTDVLDTWFSSGLLPLSTAGWTGQALLREDIDAYPLTFIESGGDILTFWLARMAMLCTWFTDKLPFPEIILHSLICDAQGKKMSKTVGNVIDPMYIVNGRTHAQIKEDMEAKYKEAMEHEGGRGFKSGNEMHLRLKELKVLYPQGFVNSGADALRMALVDLTRRYTHINLEMSQVDSFRKLAIKVENTFKLIDMMRGDEKFPPAIPPTENLKLHDLRLLHTLQVLVSTVNTAFEQRRLFDATSAIRTFFFESLGNSYLELIKGEVQVDPQRRADIMGLVALTWDILLRLLHPFMPYISETLYQALMPRDEAESIVVAPFPLPTDLPEITETDYQDSEMVVQLIRAFHKSSGRMKNGTTAVEFRVIVPQSESKALQYLDEMWETITKIKYARAAVKVEDDGEVRKAVQENPEEWCEVMKREEGSGWESWKNLKDNSTYIFWTTEEGEL